MDIRQKQSNNASMKNIEILFEDENILALNKSVGVPVHPDGKRKMYCITDFLMENYPKVKGVGEPLILANGAVIDRPGIVHRIDKDTSGVLLVAKTEEGYNSLKSQFKAREIKKTYHTFVYGDLKDERGVINMPIGRSAGALKQWAVTNIRGMKRREAVTKYKVLKHSREASFLEVWPLTGRTHQIRVHMKHIHHAVVCDPIYAPKKVSILGFKRLALHASKIVFKNLKGKEIEVEAPLPADFEKARKTISNF